MSMSFLEKNIKSLKSISKVVIVLRDRNAVGKVYAKIDERLSFNDLLLAAIKDLEEGKIYADESCTQLIQDDFIELYEKSSTKHKMNDFVFLLDRKTASENIAEVKIMKNLV